MASDFYRWVHTTIVCFAVHCSVMGISERKKCLCAHASYAQSVSEREHRKKNEVKWRRKKKIETYRRRDSFGCVLFGSGRHGHIISGAQFNHNNIQRAHIEFHVVRMNTWMNGWMVVQTRVEWVHRTHRSRMQQTHSHTHTYRIYTQTERQRPCSITL